MCDNNINMNPRARQNDTKEIFIWHIITHSLLGSRKKNGKENKRSKIETDTTLKIKQTFEWFFAH